MNNIAHVHCDQNENKWQKKYGGEKNEKKKT